MPAILPDCPGLQEKDEYVENIIADIHGLGLRFEKITYTSDYFPQLKECGECMIKAGERMCDTVGAGRLAVGGLFCVKECGERMIEAGACGRGGQGCKGCWCLKLKGWGAAGSTDAGLGRRCLHTVMLGWRCKLQLTR
jgi:hypothetical protein